MTKIIGGIVQQSVERIDRTRNIAGKSLFSLIHSEYLNLRVLPYSENLKTIFDKTKCSEIDWNLAHATFELFIQLLSVKELKLYLLKGIIYSIGSLTESLVKPATQILLKQLKVS